MKKGTKIIDRYGKAHEVLEVRGTTVITYRGQYLHITKITKA